VKSSVWMFVIKNFMCNLKNIFIIYRVVSIILQH